VSKQDDAMGASNLALALVAGKNVAAGLAMHRRAVALDPDWRWAAMAAGSLLNHGHVDEAAELLERCPSNEPQVMMTTAFVLWERGDPGQAAGLLRLACRLRPKMPGWLTAHAQATLASGDWEHGFQFHECRERRQQLGAKIPRWDGEYTDRLLIWSDEGMGDAVQFARFIPEIAKRVGKAVFGMPSALIGLLGGYSGHAEILDMGNPQDLEATAEVALMSLPMYCGATPDHLTPDPGLLRCASVSGALTEPGRRNVAVAWTGNPAFERAHLRDMKLETMLGLTEDPDNRLFSVVVGSKAADIAKAGAQALVTDLSGCIMQDFSATAAVLKEMDAVVTTCNGIAHIAGALGVPTFLCLATLADWRWLTGRTDTPWYPSVRLIRQESPNVWAPVVAAAREMLAAIPVRGAARPTEDYSWARATPAWGEHRGAAW
jgi:hypothetical protein